METIIFRNYTIKKNILILGVFGGILVLFTSCSGDDENNPKGTYEYTIAGGISKVVEGTEAEFFTDNGIFYVVLDKGTDQLFINIYADPIIEKSYSIKTETNAEVQTGSTFTGDFHSFITNFGTGGSVSITSVEANVVKGTFTMNMDDNSPISPIVVNVDGTFTAIKR